jgi:hypothetical protein
MRGWSYVAGLLIPAALFAPSPGMAQDFSCEIGRAGHEYRVYLTGHMGATTFQMPISCTIWCKMQATSGPITRSCHATFSGSSSYKHVYACGGSTNSIQLLEVTRTIHSCGTRR